MDRLGLRAVRLGHDLVDGPSGLRKFIDAIGAPHPRAVLHRPRDTASDAIRALLDAEGALEPAVEAQMVELRDACFASADFVEGVRAFAEKRPPQWLGR